LRRFCGLSLTSGKLFLAFLPASFFDDQLVFELSGLIPQLNEKLLLTFDCRAETLNLLLGFFPL